MCLLLLNQNHYASAAKQMDHLWQEVQPLGRGGTTETGFDMKIVTPVDSGHPTAEQLQQHQQMLQQGKLAKGASVFVGEYCIQFLALDSRQSLAHYFVSAYPFSVLSAH